MIYFKVWFFLPDLWLTQCWYVSEMKMEIGIDKTRASSQINETHVSLLTFLIFHDERTDIGYRAKRGLNSFIENQINFRANHSIKI